MAEESECDFIPLRKVAYGEHSLIFSGLSPEYGRISFLIKGAAVARNRYLPEVELFRLLHLGIVMGNGDLHRVRTAELLEDFGGVAQDYGGFQAANWIAAFSLGNVQEMLPHPHYFNAVEVALRRLSTRAMAVDAVLTGVCMAFLFEEGWLAHAVSTPEASSQCRVILEMAAGNPPPAITPQSWRAQLNWARQLLLLNDCRLPDVQLP